MFWFQNMPTVTAFIEYLAGIHRHDFFLAESAGGAGNYRV
jgi:hypothetical protein